MSNRRCAFMLVLMLAAAWLPLAAQTYSLQALSVPLPLISKPMLWESTTGARSLVILRSRVEDPLGASNVMQMGFSNGR